MVMTHFVILIQLLPKLFTSCPTLFVEELISSLVSVNVKIPLTDVNLNRARKVTIMQFLVARSNGDGPP